jgi:hypothetical protein
MAGRVAVTLSEGDQPLEVVGEEQRQRALWDLVGGASDLRVRQPIHAILLHERGNPYDDNAVAVWIDGNHVGYLPRQLAARYRAGLEALQQRHGTPIALAGAISGGGDRDGQRGKLGVFLDHDPADFGIF